jgi:tetratricopeptide (TPR) repeat protein
MTSAKRRGYERTADLNALCRLLVHRGRKTGSRGDLDRAVALGQRALKRTPAGYVLFEACQENLALALRSRHELRADTEESPTDRYDLRRPADDLGLAVRLAQRAVEAVSADAPGRAVHELNLALALDLEYQQDQDPEKLAWAMEAASAATRSTADVPTRVSAGLAWSAMAASAGRYADAVTAFESVIGLLPQIASGELRRADQENRLARWTGIAVTAAACALAEGRGEKAVAFLEQGRGILLSRGLDVRTDLTSLRARHPALAGEFDRLRAEIEATYDLRSTAPGARDHVRQQRRRQSGRWDELLERIRAEAGFEEFARAPSLDRILAQAHQGPVVYLNLSEERSDAIILGPGGARTVPLGVGPREADEQVRKLHAALRPDRVVDPREHRPVFEVLAWLWDELVEPVLDALAPLASAPGAPPPRVWWVPTGPATLLPIHAAGHHDARAPGGSRSALDRVISSYTPTVRALAAARGQESVSGPPRRLVVAMPETPDAEPLRGVAEEVKVIQGLFADARVLSGREATKHRVLAELPHHTWAHFACHAVADQDIPSRGRLLLDDHEERPLTVDDIARLELDGLELAYLSSCDSARTGPRHVDEAVNLASTFQLAGFPHVVATLWPALDRFAVGFAEDVYRRLAAGGDADVALAVHSATRTARERFPNLPGLWAGHVHVGR